MIFILLLFSFCIRFQCINWKHKYSVYSRLIGCVGILTASFWSGRGGKIISTLQIRRLRTFHVLYHLIWQTNPLSTLADIAGDVREKKKESLTVAAKGPSFSLSVLLPSFASSVRSKHLVLAPQDAFPSGHNSHLPRTLIPLTIAKARLKGSGQQGEERSLLGPRNPGLDFLDWHP